MVRYSLTVKYRDNDVMTEYSVVRGENGHWTVRPLGGKRGRRAPQMEFASKGQALMYLLNGGHHEMSGRAFQAVA